LKTADSLLAGHFFSSSPTAAELLHCLETALPGREKRKKEETSALRPKRIGLFPLFVALALSLSPFRRLTLFSSRPLLQNSTNRSTRSSPPSARESPAPSTRCTTTSRPTLTFGKEGELSIACPLSLSLRNNSPHALEKNPKKQKNPSPDSVNKTRRMTDGAAEHKTMNEEGKNYKKNIYRSIGSLGSP
jgi:hypothetical protein